MSYPRANLATGAWFNQNALCGWYSESAREHIGFQVWQTPSGKEVWVTEVGRCEGFAPAWLGSDTVGPVTRRLRVERGERGERKVEQREAERGAEPRVWRMLFDLPA